MNPETFSIHRLAVIAATLIFLAACAGPNPPPNPRQLQVSEGVRNLLESDQSLTLADPRIRCDSRRQIGSNFPTRICMLEEEYEIAREDSLRDVFRSDQARGTGMGASGEG
ncbi:MAG: hypothetical protein ACNA7J_04630 [Wenzhouxiangella sp.]